MVADANRTFLAAKRTRRSCRDARESEKVASLQCLSDHPGTEEAFRAARHAASSGLIKIDYSSPISCKRAEPCLVESNKEWQREANSKFKALKVHFLLLHDASFADVGSLFQSCQILSDEAQGFLAPQTIGKRVLSQEI
jgi:hypothetical protein